MIAITKTQSMAVNSHSAPSNITPSLGIESHQHRYGEPKEHSSQEHPSQIQEYRLKLFIPEQP